MKKQTDITETVNQLPEMSRYGTLQIKRWMIFEYKLSGMALLLFALIYQTRNTTKKQGWTAAELSEWFAKDVDNIRHTLGELVAKGHLRHDNMFYTYLAPKRHRLAHRFTPEERAARFHELIQQEHIFD